MKIAVIGSAGQVGQEFCKCLPAEKLISLTREQIDVTDAGNVIDCVQGLDCDVLVNLAAFHDVNGCEEDPAKAFQVNAMGAGYVAQAAQNKGCKVVYFSSDYVFGLDERRRSPYLESDVLGPLSTYGVSKVAGEHLVRAATGNHLIIRSSSLFGVITSKKGWTFPEMILRRARSGEPLRVVNDQYMSPTYTLDLVGTVIRLLEKDASGTVHVTNGSGCTWWDFATATLESVGIDTEIVPVQSSEFPSKAVRPMYSRLDSQRLESLGVPAVREWREGLRAYLTEKGEI